MLELSLERYENNTGFNFAVLSQMITASEKLLSETLWRAVACIRFAATVKMDFLVLLDVL